MVDVGGGSLAGNVGFLRPARERLDLVVAGAVPLALAVVMINVRFDGVWGRGVLLVVTLLACAVVLGPGMAAEREGEHPAPAHTALLVAGLALLALAIFRLARVFGVDDPLSASGTAFWMSVLFAGIAAFPAWGRLNSPVCALIEALAGGTALLAFVDWVFEPHGPTTSRWMLLVLVVLYAAAMSRARGSRPRHAVQLANATGIAALALIFSFGIPFDGERHASTWWELVIVLAGLALIAYAILERHRGPGYLGFAVLLGFALLAGQRDPQGASLVGWPLLLLLAGGGVLAFALRPARRPLPPAPPPP
ncbi:MAG: hypothetical protein M3155_08675, partial [Actinomycetota bacterium]|nr:hypothetical protein [Actinomycetota bacterium]